MAQVADFTIDNLGSADQYTVKTVCKTLRVREKDRTVASLSGFAVYIPATGAAFTQYLPGEEFVLQHPVNFLPGDKPIALHSLGAASVVFSVIEQ